MKKQTSGTLTAITPAKVKRIENKTKKILSTPTRYIYTEQDLGEGILHIGVKASTYAAFA
ncbi:MAG: hypothetical protein H7X88_10440 [Gloeobacteraceae cyanobacterium ES-bin-316]|nr:hypothetical protein [Ferruginibacter sp.]